MNDLREKLDKIRSTLWAEGNALLDLRTALWDAGNAEAATAVDEARNGLFRSMHDLKRAYPRRNT